MTSKLQPSKSRTDKSGSKSQLSNIATPVTHDIVPGKFTDQDWNFMLEKDDAQEFITDIVEEVYSAVDKIIYDQYIERSIVPYTVSEAKDAVVQIIEWLYIDRDPGESPAVHYRGWEQDEEPDVPVIDCWAQGSVPKMTILRRPSSVIREETAELMQSLADGTAFEEKETTAEPKPTGCTPEPDPSAYAGPFIPECPEDDTEYKGPFVFKDDAEYEGPFVFKEPEETPDDTQAGEKPEVAAQEPPVPECVEYAGPFNEPEPPPPCDALPCEPPPCFEPLSGSLAHEKMMEKLDREREAYEEHKRIIPKRTPNISDSNQYLDAVTGKPIQTPTVKEMTPTQAQYVGIVPSCEAWTSHASLKKINPTSLPSNRVETSFCVIEVPPADGGKSGPARKSGFKKQSTQGTSKLNSDKSGSTLMPRSLIDAMDVSAGVVVREKDRVKKGPRQSNLHTEIMNQALARGLQPVRVTPLQEMDINDFLDRHSPVVRPLASTPPIPPIPRTTPLRSQ